MTRNFGSKFLLMITRAESEKQKMMMMWRYDLRN